MVSEFGPWSPCPDLITDEDCQARDPSSSLDQVEEKPFWTERKRVVLHRPNNGGKNCPDLVEDLLQALKLDGDTVVMSPTKEEKPLRETLFRDCAITAPDKKFLKLLAEKAGAGADEDLPEPG